MNEFALIRRYFDRPVQRARLGIGDDCALLDNTGTLAISTDMLVAGRHFFDDVDAAALGHKSLAVNLSDLAAMGAQPLAFTLALALPEHRAADDLWLAQFTRGLFALADQHQCELIGGDTTAGPLTISITVFGQVDPQLALRRSGARVGDDIYVSGQLGDAALALRLLQRERGAAVSVSTSINQLPLLRDRLDMPQPRVHLGRALLGIATSAIDLSDGLAGDLPHILQASEVAAEIDIGAVPISPLLRAEAPAIRDACALAGGDDYELCFTAPGAQADAVRDAARQAGVAVTRIGRILAGPAQITWRENGRCIALALRGFDHFAAPAAQ